MCWCGRWTGLPSTCRLAISRLLLTKSEETEDYRGEGVFILFFLSSLLSVAYRSNLAR
jgi:hypothetical protein